MSSSPDAFCISFKGDFFLKSSGCGEIRTVQPNYKTELLLEVISLFSSGVLLRAKKQVLRMKESESLNL